MTQSEKLHRFYTALNRIAVDKTLHIYAARDIAAKAIAGIYSDPSGQADPEQAESESAETVSAETESAGSEVEQKNGGK